VYADAPPSGIFSRAESDAYAMGSQAKWKAAQASGQFDAEMAPLELQGKKVIDYLKKVLLCSIFSNETQKDGSSRVKKPK